jgi:hypothetical protein
MTFLNPLALIGLATAAIPIILHLLNLRRLRTIEFSTLTFLKELQQTKIRKLKLKQMLLLIIRTLMIIFIVLGFSRPAFRGTMLGGIGSHTLSTVIILLDDSFSMSAQDEDGELFKQAKETTLKVLDLLKEGDEAYLIKLSRTEEAELIPPHDFKMLRRTVIESRTSLIRNPIERALRLSAKIIGQSKNANKEIYLISDFQKTLLTEEMKPPTTKISLFEKDVKFFRMKIGKKEIQNTAIDSLVISSKIFERNKPITLNAVIKNYNNRQLKNCVGSLYLDGVRVCQSTFNLDEWETSQITLIATPKNSGLIKGYLELENDELEPDNRRYFTLNIPQKLRILIITSSADGTRLIKLALKASVSENPDSLLDIAEITPTRLSTFDINKVDVMVICDLTNLAISDNDRISRFIEQGGGLLLFPGEEISFDQYNPLLTKLNIPPLEGILRTPQDGSITFHKIDFDHPVFSGVFKETNKEKNLESPQIYIYAKREAGKLAQSVITLSNGSPFLTDQKYGDGRILLFSVAPIPSWSNFPLKSIFAPLIYRSLIYASTGNAIQYSFIVGQEAVVKLIGEQINQTKYSTIFPDATEEIINTVSEKTTLNQSRLLSIGKLLQSGIYEIRNNSKKITLISSNVDRMESDTRISSTDELNSYWEKFGIPTNSVKEFRSYEQIRESVLASRYGTELWRYAVGFVLVLALLEMFIALNRNGKKD